MAGGDRVSEMTKNVLLSSTGRKLLTAQQKEYLTVCRAYNDDEKNGPRPIEGGVLRIINLFANIFHEDLLVGQKSKKKICKVVMDVRCYLFLIQKLAVLSLTMVILNLFFVHATNGAVAQLPDKPTSQGYTITKTLLSNEQGLASHEVFCGVVDSSGFLWFGTRNGLNRYDGQRTLLFTRQRNKLQENKVVKLAVDDANKLFILYGSAGFQLITNGKVDVLDGTTQRVKTLAETFPQLPFKEKDVYWLASDGSGEVNILTTRPFRYWKYNSKTGFKLCLQMKDWDTLGPNYDYRITGPLCTFINGKAFLKIDNRQTQYLVSANTVTKIKQHDVLRSLPIGFTASGQLLITFNTEKNTEKFALGILAAGGQLRPLTDAQPYHLDYVKDKYWFQIAAGQKASAFYIPSQGLYIWNQEAFVKVFEPSSIRGFENLFIYQTFSDSLGNTWLCTSLGVIQLKIKKNRFTHYFSSEQQSVEPNSQVRGIYADAQGSVVANVWWHTFQNKNGTVKALKEPEIHYGLTKHQNDLYSGGYSLYRYDEKNNKSTAYPSSLGSEIWSIFSLSDSLLLMGRTGGFLVFNSKWGRFDSVSVAGENARFVYRFFKGTGARVWAVAENGLFKLSSDKKHGKTLIMEMLRSSFLNGLSLLDAYQDADGIFWLATNGEGLYRWDPKSNRAKQFNITDGFPSDVLYRIEADQKGKLWISSDNGLIHFDPHRYTVNTFTTTDGISNNEFNRTSSFKSQNGRLFFGGLNGVNAFDPNDFVSDTTSLRAPLQITGYSQFVGSQNRLVDKTTALLKDCKIILEPDDKFFILDFQLLDFVKDQGHRYAYKIEGLDKDWIFINENSVRLSNLPYGAYLLSVRAQDRQGTWNKNQLHIPILALRPFYMQWWFVALVTVMLGTAIYLLFKLRLRKMAYDKRRLEELISQRTTQLQKSITEQSALLLEKDVLMKEIHHRVKNNLQVISGLLELQSKTLNDAAARAALQEGRNRVQSIALIHQNLYQFENLSAIDLKLFVSDLCTQVQSVFQRQKSVDISLQVPELALDIDSAVPLGLILNELLTNSFKYAFKQQQSGQIALHITLLSEGRYQLEYCDNGPGLPEGLDLGRSKTLGLQLVSDLSRQIGGKVNYQTQNGACFIINFTNRSVRKNQD